MSGIASQLINLFAAMLLLLAFAMISQRRVLSLIYLFTLQGATLAAATAVVGYATHQPHLYISASITLVLKVFLISRLHLTTQQVNPRSMSPTKCRTQSTRSMALMRTCMLRKKRC